MSAPALPGAQPGPSSQPSAPASQRAREMQDALKSIVLQTASTLRARTQLAGLPSSIPRSSATAAASVNEASSSLDKLTGECTRYLSLVHGLRDYLLHAQAALEIELEAATQREAEEAEKAAEAAAEALKRQQEAEEKAKKEAQEEAERKRIAEEAKAKDSGSSENQQEPSSRQNAEDTSTSVPTTPPLPSGSTGASDGKNDKAGKAAGDAIIIDSDGDDEDDVPLAFAPKPGSAEDASKTIDLTDSPALTNAAKPVVPVSQPQRSDPVTASSTTKPAADATTSDATAPSIPGLDLSAFGIDMSTLGNLPDLSSLNIPGLTNTTSTDTSTSLAPASDFSELEKMMGMDFSSTASGSNDQSSAAMPDLYSLGNINVGSGAGGFGEDGDMFSTGNGGLDLSNFDFSGLAGGTDTGMGGGGGVDLSSFLTNFAPGAEGGSAVDGGAGS